MPAVDNRYELRGASLDAPREWTEESVLTLVAPGPRPQPMIALVRVTVPVDTTLELFAARRMADLSTTLEGLQIGESKEVSLAGQRAMQLRLSWQEHEGRVHQRLLVTRAHGAMFVLTMTCLEEQVARAQPVFDGAVASFRLPTS